MFDIDKELEGLKSERYCPSEALREETRRKIKKSKRSGQERKTFAVKPALKICTAAALALVLLVAMSINFATSGHAAGYYTVDINPSLSFAVDENDQVLYVKAENKDAEGLLSGLNLEGMKAGDALRLIIQTAVKDSYLKDNGNVLVAHFGSGKGITQEEASSIVADEALGNVNVLVINGGINDYEKAEKSGEKAGVELLLNNAKGLGIDDEDISDVIKKVSEKGKSSDKSNNGNGSNSNNANGGNSSNNNPNKDKNSNKDGNSNNNKDSNGNGKSGGDSKNSGKDSPNPTKDKGNDKNDNKKNNNK